ncbi:hypothetical protein J6590_058113 [Homalodisca vitripennis]|nr:hypothetical protein J6590_058113 [Homalodisca vitripennis]
MPNVYSLVQGFSPRLDLTRRRSQAKLLSSNRLHTTTSASKLSIPCRPVMRSSADAAAATSELRLTALPQIERSPNLKSTLYNGMTTTTTIDENKSTHLLSKIIVVGVFMFPNGNKDVFMSKFESLLTGVTNRQLKFGLLGDFNIDAMNQTHPSTKRFVNMLQYFGLQFLVKDPTRVTPTTQSAIDIVISNLLNVAVSVINTAIADHFYQEAIIIIRLQIEREPKTNKTIRDIRPSNIALLNASFYEQ